MAKRCKERAGKCITPRCRNPHGSKGRYKKCHKCRSRQYKLRHPYRYYFNLARQRAKSRKWVWTLSFEFYENLCREAGWDESKRGRNLMDYSIDRIDSTRGYSPDNVRVCSISENAAKGDSDITWLKHYGPFAQLPKAVLPKADEIESEEEPF